METVRSAESLGARALLHRCDMSIDYAVREMIEATPQ